jgi:hypothetical protein
LDWTQTTINVLHAAAVLTEHLIAREHYAGQEILMLGLDYKKVREIMIHLHKMNKDSFSLSRSWKPLIATLK